jgi:hypothetical protein
MQVQVTPDGSITELKPAQAPITVRHLLTHTAGLGYSIIQKGPLKDAYEAAGLVPGQASRLAIPPFSGVKTVPSLAQFADKLAEMPLVYEPGTRWSYSVGLDLLGRIIEVVSGQDFAAVLAARIVAHLHDPQLAVRSPGHRHGVGHQRLGRGQLHLQRPLARPRALGEDVQDEGGAVAQAQAGQPPAAPVPAEGQPALKDKTQIKDELLANPQRWAGTPPERNPILLRQEAARLEGEVRQLRDKARRIATTMPENTVEGPRLTSEANQLDANRKEMIDRSERVLDEAAELAYKQHETLIKVSLMQ